MTGTTVVVRLPVTAAEAMTATLLPLGRGRIVAHSLAPIRAMLDVYGKRGLQMGNDTPLLVSVKDAMRLLRVGRNTLWSWEKAGHLRPVSIGRPDAGKRTIRYRRDQIEALARGEQL